MGLWHNATQMNYQSRSVSKYVNMAIRAVEFSSGKYKIRKKFAQESTYPKKVIEF